MFLIFTIFTFLSTLAGGLIGIKYRDKLHLILGFTAGVLLSLIAFDLFPEIIRLSQDSSIDITYPMIFLVLGFLVFHITEKFFSIHREQEDHYETHHHVNKGVISASALIAHSFLDGVGIGLGFQISQTTGVLVAIAVIAHDFSDGLNTASFMLMHKNNLKQTFIFVFLDAFAPVLGALSTLLFIFNDLFLLAYLGFFAGFLLYISTSEILPEAHSEHSSVKTMLATILGVLFIFLVTRFGV